MIGIRGMDYEEDYAFNAVHADGGLGFHRVSTDNFYLGLQTGVDAFYPISQRLSIVHEQGWVYSRTSTKVERSWPIAV